jgi:hypothetical protein
LTREPLLARASKAIDKHLPREPLLATTPPHLFSDFCQRELLLDRGVP